MRHYVFIFFHCLLCYLLRAHFLILLFARAYIIVFMVRTKISPKEFKDFSRASDTLSRTISLFSFLGPLSDCFGDALYEMCNI